MRLLLVWSVRCWRLPDSDSGQPENRPCRVWFDEDIPADYNNIRDLGSRIYTEYLLPFELAAVLLLLGMVAAIALVHRKTTNPKRMDPADQVKVRADQGRMRLVKMEAVKPQTESLEENEVSDDLKPKEEGKA